MIQSAEDLERVIRRGEMNRGQTTLLKYLYEADGEYVERDDIVADIRWNNDKSFVGVLSAFSNRVNNTEGIAENSVHEAFIERRDIDGQEHFRLRNAARRAIEAVPELVDIFDKRSMEELLDNKGKAIRRSNGFVDEMGSELR